MVIALGPAPLGVDEGITLGSLAGRRVYRMRLTRAENMPGFRWGTRTRRSGGGFGC